MPAKSKKQERFMQAAAHNPSFAKKAGISQKAAKEFLGKKNGGSVNRVGRAVHPTRRDPDIGKMIKEAKVPTNKRRG